jgi:DNA-binding MarR family transcriptional regulator
MNELDKKVKMTSQDKPLKKALLDWSNTFMQLSLNDLSRYAHTVGLSLAQMSILMHLHFEGACEVTRFSEMLKISRAAASQMIERLAQQGVVQRLPSPHDRRVRFVDLTPNGELIVAESLEARVEWVNELVDQISTEERENFYTTLTKLNLYALKENMEKTGNEI